MRVVFERTEPTVDVDVQGDGILRTLERDGEPLTAPPDGTYTLHIDGISIGGTIDCNDYGGVLTVDGSDVNARYGAQTDGLPRPPEFGRRSWSEVEVGSAVCCRCLLR